MTKPTRWHVRPAKTQISLGIRPVWSESSMSAWRKPRLIWVFAGRTVILSVLWWGGSFFLLMYSFVIRSCRRRHQMNKNLVMRKPIFGVCDQVRHKPACALTEARWRLEISDIELEVLYYLGSEQQRRWSDCTDTHMVKTCFLMTWLN